MTVVPYNNMHDNRVKNVSDPIDEKDAVNLGYLMNSVYPVGAIYISTLATNPGTLFGFGTWTAFGAGKALVGLDSGDTDFDTVEETRGAKTHTLGITEIPSHGHGLATRSVYVTTGGAQAFDPNGTDQASYLNGGGQAHNNIQPSIVVYMFKRTA